MVRFPTCGFLLVFCMTLALKFTELGALDEQTGRQTDGRTDRQIAALLNVCPYHRAEGITRP